MGMAASKRQNVTNTQSTVSMARTRCIGVRTGTSRYQQHKESLENLRLLAVLLLTDADDDDEETDALAFAQLVLAMKKQSFFRGGGRYGMRGEYREPKSKDFFDLLMYQFSERWFKAWLR